MFLLVPAHPGCPGQFPQSRKTVVCVCVCVLCSEMFCLIVLMAVGGERVGSIQIGVWILVGLLTFMIIEKIFPESSEDEDHEDINSTVCICTITEIVFVSNDNVSPCTSVTQLAVMNTLSSNSGM